MLARNTSLWTVLEIIIKETDLDPTEIEILEKEMGITRILSERQNHKILKDKDSITHKDNTTSENNELNSKEEQEEIPEKQIIKS